MFFENLCSGVILRLDFQGRHQRVTIEFNGESNDLVISGKSTCAVTGASTDAVSLFSNLAPIVTKSLGQCSLIIVNFKRLK